MSKLIELKSIEYAESMKDYIVLPTQLRSKPFKSSHRNLLSEYPIFWHCFYCSDTNRFNDRINIFNQFNETDYSDILEMPSYLAIQDGNQSLPYDLNQHAVAVPPVAPNHFVVFDFGSAVFDLEEIDDSTSTNIIEIEQPQDNSTFDFSETEVVPNDSYKIDEEVNVLDGQTDPSALHHFMKEPEKNNFTVERGPNLSNQEPAAQEQEVHAEVPENNGQTEPSVLLTPANRLCPSVNSSEAEETESDSEIIASHFPIAILFFIIGLISSYSVGHIRKYISDFFIEQKRRYLDNLEKEVIGLLSADKFEKTVKLLQRELTRVIRYRSNKNALRKQYSNSFILEY